MLIIHANLYTMEQDPIPDGYIQTCGDKILQVGRMPPPPGLGEGETVVDAKGHGAARLCGRALTLACGRTG
ncbi:MAG: hypothetical protein ACLSAP_09300 [Oscillospiraceae bacterium]